MIKVIAEIDVKSFEFWGGAKDVAERLTTEQWIRIEEYIQELYPEGIDETELNDIVWFYLDELFGE